MKKKIIIGIISVVVIFIIGLFIFFNIRNVRELQKNKTYFENKNTILAVDDYISKQAKVDEEISHFIQDSNYTLQDPKVIENPYSISPLSAIVIFQTKQDVSVELYVNNILMTTYEKSLEHAIEVYGLRAGYENHILLKTSDGNEKEIIIQTDQYVGQILKIDKKNAILKDNFYFVSAPMGLGISAFDAEGNVVWYLTENYNQDIEFLSNGHILVSNGEPSGNEFGFTGFVEVDFLGKVYHTYVLENIYHHEVNELSNGNLLIAGNSNLGDASEAYVYTIDRNTGKVLDDLNIYELFKNIDEKVINRYRDVDFVNNSIDYHEDTDEMILSLRGLNTVISVQYHEKKLNWILGSASMWTGKFSNYLLQLANGTRLPKGQHTAFLMEDGKLALFNNDFDPMAETMNVTLDHFRNNYSSAMIFEIKNKTISSVYEYVDPDRAFCYALGSFNITNDNHKLVNFGWTFKPEAIQKNLNLYDYFGHTYSRITELDSNNQIVFDATIDQSLYRVFKNSFYGETTSNYQVLSYTLIDNIEYNDLQKVKTSSLYDLLDSAEPTMYDFEVTQKSVKINAIFDDLEEVSFLFVGENQDSYIFVYKPRHMSEPTKINLNLTGSYALYLKIEDQVYESGKILSFNE